jgi:predicted O-methyltransferase YrrM
MHVGNGNQAASSLQRWVSDVRLIASVRVLPPRVALFFVRAWRHARRTEDQFSIDSAIRPRELRALLRLANGRQEIVELGTGTAWSAIGLALDASGRRVVTYDSYRRPEREAYLDRAWPKVRGRIEFREAHDTSGPHLGESVDFLFVDSGHDRESVVGGFMAWRASLVPGATVVFHDYDNPKYPGVRDAIDELALSGHQYGGLYVWRAPMDAR